MHYVICAENVHGEPEPLADSVTNETEKFTSVHAAEVECRRLNEDTEGGYFICAQLGAGTLERVRA
jgi:hypothetical protein